MCVGTLWGSYWLRNRNGPPIISVPSMIWRLLPVPSDGFIYSSLVIIKYPACSFSHIQMCLYMYSFKNRTRKVYFSSEKICFLFLSKYSPTQRSKVCQSDGLQVLTTLSTMLMWRSLLLKKSTCAPFVIESGPSWKASAVNLSPSADIIPPEKALNQ